MKLPDPVFKGSAESLPGLIEANRREEEARLRLIEDLTLDELFLNLSSRDHLSKSQVRRALPVRYDREMPALVNRLVRDASIDYLQLHKRWQREAVGYLTSLGAEALLRLGGGALEAPDNLDYVGLQAEGEPGRRAAIRARKMGDFAGLKARHANFSADSMGDFCLRQAAFCRAEVKTVGQCMGQEGVELSLYAREAGDWLMLRSKSCFVDARRVGRLAGLDSHNLEMRVQRAGAELGERAHDAVIYLYRGARSLGQNGSGVIYMRRGAPAWRTSFRVERTLQAAGRATCGNRCPGGIKS